MERQKEEKKNTTNKKNLARFETERTREYCMHGDVASTNCWLLG